MHTYICERACVFSWLGAVFLCRCLYIWVSVYVVDECVYCVYMWVGVGEYVGNECLNMYLGV